MLPAGFKNKKKNIYKWAVEKNSFLVANGKLGLLRCFLQGKISAKISVDKFKFFLK